MHTLPPPTTGPGVRLHEVGLLCSSIGHWHSVLHHAGAPERTACEVRKGSSSAEWALEKFLWGWGASSPCLQLLLVYTPSCGLPSCYQQFSEGEAPLGTSVRSCGAEPACERCRKTHAMWPERSYCMSSRGSSKWLCQPRRSEPQSVRTHHQDRRADFACRRPASKWERTDLG